MCQKWYKLPYEDRLEIAEFIFQMMTSYPACSFRRLIYDRLGFSHDAYLSLYLSGGMIITNALIETDAINPDYEFSTELLEEDLYDGEE